MIAVDQVSRSIAFDRARALEEIAGSSDEGISLQSAGYLKLNRYFGTRVAPSTFDRWQRRWISDAFEQCMPCFDIRELNALDAFSCHFATSICSIH